jgi:hypothetical protein
VCTRLMRHMVGLAEPLTLKVHLCINPWTPHPPRAEFEAAKGSNWIVSGWGSTSINARNETGMGGQFATELQYGTLRYVKDDAKQCSDLVKDNAETMIW